MTTATSAAPPTWLDVSPVAIPPQLRARPQWIVWRGVFVPGKNGKPSKWTKEPYRANAPDEHAATDDPSTWAPFPAALDAYTRIVELDGVGYALAEDDGITGIDLDHCRTPETGAIAPWAQAIVDRFMTYTEVSPSATGLRLFVAGTLPPGRRVLGGIGPQQDGKIEVYDSGRYLTVTGCHLAGTSAQVESRQAVLERWHAELFPPEPAAPDRPAGNPPTGDDVTLLALARRAANGEKFVALFDRGDTSAYASASEGDLALGVLLAFWTQKDAARIDRLFRQSALMRDKWDERRGPQTYGEKTIAVALKKCRESYAPRVETATPPAPAEPGSESWPTLAPEALHGVAGRLVRAIDPHTEADPVATLGTFLTAVGNVIGPGPHAQAGEDAHPARLFVSLVGESSKGRKGMSWRPVLRMLSVADDLWARSRVASGLSSGEGVIYHVRDPREERQPVKEKGRVTGYQAVMVDEGVSDKRLLVEEPELASVLRRMDRESNSLSAVLRQAWDRGHLGTLTKNSPLRATDAHVSLLAHVTQAELIANLGATERANGFANRILFLLVKRSKELPDPQPIPPATFDPLAQELLGTVLWARGVDVVRRDPTAETAWAAIYGTLSAARPGLLGAITNRAEAQVLRLSTLYALLDRSAVIRLEHLQAALALWTYAEQSARLIFGTRTGDPIADTIEAACRARGPLTRTALSDLFSRNVPEARIEAALRSLAASGRLRRDSRQTGGRPAETWTVIR